MPFASAGPGEHLLVQRSPGVIRGCIMFPTLLLGLAFAGASVKGLLVLLRVIRGQRPQTTSTVLALVIAGGLMMALFGLFGLTGRSEVRVDTTRRLVTVTLRAFGLRLKHREHAAGSFDRVEVRTGLGRSTPNGPAHRFFFAALRGEGTSISLERLDREGAIRQADEVAGWLWLRRGPDDAG